MIAEAVNQWVICISGWGQNEGMLTGIENLQDRIYRQCASDTSKVLLRAWNDTPEHVASRIWNRRPVKDTPRVVLIGYSYGGCTAIRINDALEDRGIPVAQMVLCDAIWRYSSAPTFFSLLPWWKLRVSSNVKNLWTYRQDQDAPRGHRVKRDDNYATKLMRDRVVTNRSHEYMDELPEFVDNCLAIACPRGDEP